MKVLVTRRIPVSGLNLLKPHFEVDYHDSRQSLSREQLKRRLCDAEALLCLLTDRIDRDVIDAAPRLRIISNHAVGVDNIDLSYATTRGIAVCNTPDVLTEATADFAWALMMTVCRRIIPGERLMRSGGFQGWDPLDFLGEDFTGKTLGIVGAGRIGTAVAQRSCGWKMKILYFNRSRNLFLEEKLKAKQVALDALLKDADFVSIHLPLSAQTHHLIGARELAMMKPGAFLINTARGAIIEEQALVAALQRNQIAGAALDVFENEPHLASGLRELENVVLTPHIASATLSTRSRMAEMAAGNIVDFLHGRRPPHIVNPVVMNQENL